MKMKNLLVVILLLCNNITKGQVLTPNQNTIKHTFKEFREEGDSVFHLMDNKYVVSFKRVKGIYYSYNGNGNTENLYYSVVSDHTTNTTYFINVFNIFTWYIVDGDVYLKQEILHGEYRGTTIIFR